MITAENYEEYMILYADGELNASETQELITFVAANGLEKELELYKAIHFPPDQSVGYEYKQQLLKPVPAARKTIPLRAWAYAAAVLLLCGTLIMRYLLQKPQQPVARNEQVQQPTPAVQPGLPAHKTADTTVVAASVAVGVHNMPHRMAKHVATTVPVALPSHTTDAPIAQQVPQTAPPQSPKPNPIVDRPAPAVNEPVAVTPVPALSPAIKSNEPEEAKAPKQTMFDELMACETSQEKVKVVAEHLKQTVSVNNDNIAINLGKKKIVFYNNQ